MSAYSYGKLAATPAATCTDLFTISGCGGGRIIEVRRVSIAGVGSVAGQMAGSLVRRSSLNTGGTSTSPAEVRHDPNDLPSGAVLTLYTANPTLGTLIGLPRVRRLTFLTNVVTLDRQEWDLMRDPAGPIRLVALTDVLAINLNGDAVPTGGTVDFDIEWVLR